MRTTTESLFIQGAEMEEQIKAKLDELRVGLQADGGDLELVKIEGI